MSLSNAPLVHIAKVGAMDASATPEAVVFVAPTQGCRILGINLIDNTAKTAHADNKGTYAILNKGAAGDGTTSVASRVTDTPTTDDIAAYVPWPITLTTTLANLEIAGGRVLTIKATEAGTATSGDLVDCSVQILYAEGYGGGI